MGLMSTSCDVKFDNHNYKWITLVFERGSDNKSSLKKNMGSIVQVAFSHLSPSGLLFILHYLMASLFCPSSSSS